MNAADDANAMSVLARNLHDEPDEATTVAAILKQAVVVLPEAQHVSVLLAGRRNGLRTVGALSALSRELDGVQAGLREGPGIDAQSGGWIRSGDVGSDPRWPRWGPAASRLGIGSAISVRLDARGRAFGAISVGSAETGRFVDPDAVNRMLLWATHAARALASARSISGLETAAASRQRIGVAQGIVMERFGLSQQASFTLLCRLSSYRNEKLRDVADVIVRTLVVPDATGTSGVGRGGTRGQAQEVGIGEGGAR